ncbi:MAG: hypothetical protein KC561_16165, partial [Myxococcales bacterium]|nr:hypothetical protein [Myxococcales bacterium]
MFALFYSPLLIFQTFGLVSQKTVTRGAPKLREVSAFSRGFGGAAIRVFALLVPVRMLQRFQMFFGVL